MTNPADLLLAVGTAGQRFLDAYEHWCHLKRRSDRGSVGPDKLEEGKCVINTRFGASTWWCFFLWTSCF